MKFEYFAAEPLSLNFKCKAFVGLKLFAVYELLVALDAGFNFSTAGTRTTQKPLSFKAENGLYAAFGVCFYLSFGFFFLEVLAVVTNVELEFVACELLDICTNSV